MTKFGIGTAPTHYTIRPADLARWAEANGFDALFYGEHTHIPVNRETPFVVGGELPEYYKMMLDPFVALTSVAAATQTLKLGTSVCVVPEHHPITLAKTIATLDLLSDGRFLFGFGAGWNAEELANHGVDAKDRWKITRERVLAMKEIWTKEIAEFHGKFENFEPLWSWPKPVQAGGPPVLMGASSKWTSQRIAEYCDGWIAPDIGDDLAPRMEELRGAVAKAGRSIDTLDLTVTTNFYRREEKSEARVRELIKMGFNRIILLLTPAETSAQWAVVEQMAGFIRRFQ